jgi:hypothetical protein
MCLLLVFLDNFRTEIAEVNKIYDKKEPITSVLHAVYLLTKYLIFDKYSELVSQVNKEIAIRVLLKISKHVYTRNISYKSTVESELFRFLFKLDSLVTA